MGTSLTRNDGIMLDSSVIAMDNIGTPLKNMMLHISGTLSGTSTQFNDSRITTSHRVINVVLGAPTNLSSNLTWTTNAGSVIFTHTLSANTSIDFELIVTN